MPRDGQQSPTHDGCVARHCCAGGAGLLHCVPAACLCRRAPFEASSLLHLTGRSRRRRRSAAPPRRTAWFPAPTCACTSRAWPPLWRWRCWPATRRPPRCFVAAKSAGCPLPCTVCADVPVSCHVVPTRLLLHQTLSPLAASSTGSLIVDLGPRLFSLRCHQLH